MTRNTFTLALLSVAAMSAQAAIVYNADVTSNAIYGSGNSNGSFTVDRDERTGLELGLRAKLRHDATGQPQNVFNSAGNGTYNFSAGVAPTQAAPTAVWSFEWAINSAFNGIGGNVGSYNYKLGIDRDAGLGTNFLEFDPINGINPGTVDGYWDHSFGDNTTAQGEGVEANNITDYNSNKSQFNVAQQSWKPHWFITGFDPTVNGTYDFYLAAFEGDAELGRTSIQVVVGTATVPEPASLALVGAALAGVALVRRRRQAR